MKRSRLAALTASAALLVAGVGSTAALAAQQSAAASMVKPPEAASGADSASNPDNMPIKRPRKPTNDKMMHEPPASGANAK